MYTLLVVDGGGARTLVVPPPPGRLLLGTDPGCDIVLSDPEAEPRHVLIEHTPAGVRASDQGTRSGTRLNGLAVSQALVRGGDQLSIGGVRITVMADSAPYPAVPAAPPALTPPAAVAPAPAAAPKPPVRVTEKPLVAGRVAPRPAGKHRRVFALAVTVAIAGVLLLLLVLSSGKSNRESAAAEAWAGAKAAWDGQRAEEAERRFLALIRDFPDAPEAERARKALITMAAERDRVAEAARTRETLSADWTQIPLRDFEKSWQAFRSKYPGTPAAEDPDFLAEVRSQYEAEGRRRFDDARGRASGFLRQSRFHDAVLVWHEYIYFPQNIPPDIASATAEFERIQVKAREAYEALAAEVETLVAARKMTEAAELLQGRLELFRGTRHAYDIRQKLEVLAVLREDSTTPPEEVTAKVESRREYLRAAEDAEGLAVRRRYADAVAGFERAADACPDPARAAEFRTRARELRDLAELWNALLSQIRDQPERFKGVELGHGLRGNVVAATEDELTVNIRGAESKLAFARMGPERILVLLTRLALDAGGQLRLAAFAFKAGDADVAHDAVTAALKASPELEPRAFELLARARGGAVPAGGFVLHRRRWITPDEKAAAELAEEIAAAEKDAGSEDARRRESGLSKLREMGAPARPALVRALGRGLENAVAALEAHPAIRDPATKAQLFRELTERRKAAFALIFDEAKYPYPHPEGPEYQAVQAEVDGLVERVRVIWERPVAWLIETNEEVRALYSRAEETALELDHLGSPSAVPLAGLLGKVNEAVGIQRFPGDSAAKSAIEWSDQALRFNKDVKIEADDAERACVDATNEYRMMMGQKAVIWNAKLLACARGHSTHMREHSYFAHDVPLPGAEFDPIRTPALRARKAGYAGGVSENIARGSTDGRQTMLQWYGSSGHHRNMLGARHTEIGVGRSEDFWTENFGSAAQKIELPRAESPSK